MTNNDWDSIMAEISNCKFSEQDIVDLADFGRKIHNEAIEYIRSALCSRFERSYPQLIHNSVSEGNEA